MWLRGTSAPSPVTISLNRRRSSPALIASMLAPISSTPYLARMPASCRLDGRVERGLAAQGGQHRVRPLPGDHLLQHVQGDRLDVGGVGELRVGHDRRRVGVDQADPDALLAEHPAGLGARVVELAGLPDDDRPGPDDQHRLQVSALRHDAPCRCSISVTELAEQARRVVRARRGLGVVLDAKAGASSSRRPSTTPSLRLTWVIRAGPKSVLERRGRPPRLARHGRPRTRGCGW